MTRSPWFLLMARGSAALLSVAVGAWSATAWAADPLVLRLKDHRFAPDQVSVPAGTRFRLDVTNEDPTPAEFESGDLRAEKVVPPGATISIMAGPLKPGTYRFKDDYNEDLAHGTVVATKGQGQD